MNRHLTLQTPHGALHGQLIVPPGAPSAVLLARAHHAPLDTAIAANLAARGHAILGMDLLSAQEIQFADASQNVPRLAQRLLDLLDLARREPLLADLPLAVLASGDASPAAIRAAARRDTQIRAIACHGGLIDRAGKQALELLVAPLLLLGDPAEPAVSASYARARPYLAAPHEFHSLGPAEDPVLRVAAWFSAYLGR